MAGFQAACGAVCSVTTNADVPTITPGASPQQSSPKVLSTRMAPLFPPSAAAGIAGTVSPAPELASWCARTATNAFLHGQPCLSPMVRSMHRPDLLCQTPASLPTGPCMRKQMCDPPWEPAVERERGVVALRFEVFSISSGLVFGVCV